MIRHSVIGAAIALSFLCASPAARAQVAPSAAEASAYTGLHAAVFQGNAAEVDRLIAQKVNLEQRDGHQRTAVHIAAHRGDQAMLRKLAAAGADMRAKDSRVYDVITIAAVRDDAAMVRLAIELGGDPKAITSPYDGTALIAAAHLGHDEVIDVLIKAGAPLDHVNNLGWTAAIEAVILGNGGPRHQRSLKLLLDAGAKRDIPDREGRTPLAHAKSRGFGEMVRMLEAR
ncbi:MAG: hypothetical protein RL291_786 [Pseudomonadota bacterium]